ncbi:MAG: Cytosine-specific methyltransferase [Candidatus Nomurabacteria bacterium GW2011_GWA1_46_11]|uniref:Cytosine-specific methyltransferase n=2 Tax=Parcubacteria group TaxID=1794811 RepID=A0A1F8EYW7_9BACT|nr:MAG: Cytosine-specific methyltransferase [Candidatus Nomurabacteria bacterium GW2011_GWA1_46_11]OGN06067.1 MAG: hypothetical protein A2669_00860 [Candidatus Yanofskybacteria bacterium RIFCSPHIGHO2_01_FULL_48_25b]
MKLNKGSQKELRAIDLFAGIGGFRLGFEDAGYQIVYSNDINHYSCITYKENFGEIDEKDIREVKTEDIPDFNVLLAGFPCQPFSMIGKRDGLSDPRGQLFHEIIRIVDGRNPKAFVLENVKNLLKHNKGETYKYIKAKLENAGNGYRVFEQILDSKNFGVPQHRERAYIVGIRDFEGEFIFPQRGNRIKNKTLGDILEEKVPEQHYLSEKYYKGLLNHKRRHADKGSGFGCSVLERTGISNTLVSGNMGRERNLIKDKPCKKNRWGIRRVTPRECARLQGFHEGFKIPVSTTQAYLQFGNSVSVPVLREIAHRLKDVLLENPKKVSSSSQGLLIGLPKVSSL